MKCRVSVTLLGMSFLQSFDRQQIQNLKVIMQSRIKRNMTNPVCIMVLNQDSKPEGKQVYRTNDWRSLAEICHNQWPLYPDIVQLNFYLSGGIYPYATSGMCYCTNTSLLSKSVIKSYAIDQNYLGQWVKWSLLGCYCFGCGNQLALPMEANPESCTLLEVPV